MKKFTLFVIWALALVSTPLYATTQEYTIGVVPQFEPKKLRQIWAPIIKSLEEQAGIKLKMVGSPKIPVFEKSFVNGEFDFAYMNPYHMIVAEQAQGYIPLVRDHGRQLFGILTVKKGSDIKSLADLKGKKISFPAPNALGASLLMRADLTQLHNLEFEPLYTQTHTSSYFHVVAGLSSAGGGVMGTFNRQKQEVQDALDILYKTRKMSPHPLAAHPRVPEAIRLKVQEAMLAIGATEEGAQLLKNIPIKQIGKATIEDYQELKAWGLEQFYVSNL